MEELKQFVLPSLPWELQQDIKEWHIKGLWPKRETTYDEGVGPYGRGVYFGMYRYCMICRCVYGLVMQYKPYDNSYDFNIQRKRYITDGPIVICPSCACSIYSATKPYQKQ